METTQKECESPMKLENLLEIPLKVVKLEDLLRESESSKEPNTLGSTSNGRFCRSATSSPRQRLDEGRLLPRSSSASCLFECCEKPSRWRETEQYSNKAKFKATSIRFPDGTTAVIPVMDIDFNSNSNNKEDQDKMETDNNYERKIEKNYDQTNLERDEKRSKMESGSASSESSGVVAGSGSSLGSGCKLLKVLDKPMRFQDLLEQDAIRNLHNSISGRVGMMVGDNAITTRGDVDRGRDHQEIKEQKGFVSAEEDDTLKLTFYNDGRKESEKEFRMQCVDSISPSGGEIIACGGGGGSGANDMRSFQSAQGLQMTRVFCENETANVDNNNDSNTQVGRVSAIVRSGTVKEPDNMWEDCGDGLQILRCERRERTRERKNATPAPAYIRYAGENGESTFIKQEANTGKNEQVVAGATIQLASSPTRMLGSKDAVEDWSEQRILRVPTRPYLRRRITYEQPRQPTPDQTVTPAAVSTQVQETGLNLAKRFKPALPPVPPFNGGQQQLQQHQQQASQACANVSAARFVEVVGVSHSQPQQFSQQEQFRRPQQQAAIASQHNSISSPQMSPHQNNMIRPPQMSPQQAQNYSRFPSRNISLEDSVLIAAEAASSQDAPFNSASYYDWLRRYWDIYQRQGIDWQRIAEYYERYHFYPWDIPRAREERSGPVPTPRRRKTPIPLLPQGEAYGQQEHLQQQQHQDYAIPRSSGSITKGLPIPATSYVDGRITQLMMSQSPQQVQTPQQSPSQSHYQHQYNSQQQMQSQPLSFQNPAGYGHLQQHHQQQHQRQEYQSYHHQQSQAQARQYYPRNKRPDEYQNEYQNTSLFAQAYNQVAVAAAAAVASTSKEDQTRLNSNLASVLISNVNNNNNNSITTGNQYQYQQQQQQQQRSYNYQHPTQSQQANSITPGNGRLGPRNMYPGSHYGNNETGNYGTGSYVTSNTGSAQGQGVFRHTNEWSIRQSEGSLDISSYPQPMQQRSVIRRLSTATGGGDVVAVPVATAVKPQFQQQYNSNAY